MASGKPTTINWQADFILKLAKQNLKPIYVKTRQRDIKQAMQI